MKQLLFFVAFAAMLTIPGSAPAQFKYEYIDLKIQRNTEMPLRYFFNTVTVLDNRIDTVGIHIEEDGSEIPKVHRMKGSAAAAIKTYIDGRTGHLAKNNESLLINLLELKVPNKTFIRTLSEKSDRSGWEKVRNYVFFSADVYAGDGTGLYRKLFRIKRKQYEYRWVKETVKEILDDLVELTEQVAMDNAGKNGRIAKAYKKYSKDSLAFTLFKDSAILSMDQINIPAVSRWQHYSICKSNPVSRPCMYPLFEDFKNDLQFPATLKIVYSAADSLYDITVLPQDSGIITRHPWAVADSSGYYIRIAKSSYLKLTKDSSGFSFTVPFSMPDMYQLLSKESISAYNPVIPGGTQVFTSAPLLEGALDGVWTLAALIVHQKKADKLNAQAYSARFRQCYVDLDSGDIRY